MISRSSAREGSSSSDISVITPSPLKGESAKTRAGSATSSMLIPAASGLPMLTRICRAEEISVFPSGVESSMDASGRIRFALQEVVGTFEVMPSELPGGDELAGADATVVVGIDEGQRPRVHLEPAVGQARATHSFWSSASRFMRSAPDCSFTWSKPPARKNVHLWSVL